MTAATVAFEILLLALVGYFMEKTRMVGENFYKDLAKFISNIVLPCLILDSMQMDFSLEELKNCGYLMLLSAVFLAVGFALGSLCWRLFGKSYRGRILRGGCMFTNWANMGIPVMQALYGDDATFHLLIFIVIPRIVLYTATPYLYGEERVRNPERKRFGWVTPPLVAVPLGLLLYVTGWRLPGAVGTVVGWIGGMMSPLGMILCGLALAKYPLRSLLHAFNAVGTALRLLVMPAVMLGVCRLLGVSPALTIPVVMCTAFPVASLTLTYITRYEKETIAHSEGAGLVFLSTLLSVATIPLWYWILSLLA